MAGEIMESLKAYHTASATGFYGAPYVFKLFETFTRGTCNLVKHRDRMFKRIGSIVDQSLQGSSMDSPQGTECGGHDFISAGDRYMYMIEKDSI